MNKRHAAGVLHLCQDSSASFFEKVNKGQIKMVNMNC